MSWSIFNTHTLVTLLLIFTLNVTAATDEGISPPGRLIDVGGYRLHIHCLGNTGPTVILDAGAGGFSLEWTLIQRNLAKYTRVCAYDRAGYGWSDMGPLPRTTKRITHELYALLRNAGLNPPFILVGHSFGGYTAQHYTSIFPNHVVGMVLVDSSHPEQVQRLPVQKKQAPRHLVKARDAYFMTEPVMHENYPTEVTDIAYMMMSRWKSLLTLREELAGFPLSAAEIQALSPMPQIPLVVLTRGKRLWPFNSYGNAMEETWMQLQDELQAMSPDSIHLVAEKSGHSIHLDQPALVEYAVRKLLEDYNDRIGHVGG